MKKYGMVAQEKNQQIPHLKCDIQENWLQLFVGKNIVESLHTELFMAERSVISTSSWIFNESTIDLNRIEEASCCS